MDDRAGPLERIKESMEVCRLEDLHDLEAAFAEAAATITTLTAERDEANRLLALVREEAERGAWQLEFIVSLGEEIPGAVRIQSDIKAKRIRKTLALLPIRVGEGREDSPSVAESAVIPQEADPDRSETSGGGG
jgi:hypothetical protein